MESKDVRDKISFIESEIQESLNKPIPQTTRTTPKFQNIFLDKEKNRKEWIVMHDTNLYCLHCLCFSENRTDDISTKNGLSTISKDGKVSQKVNRHELKQSHRIATSLYHQRKAETLNQKDSYVPLRSFIVERYREVVRCIIKVVLYIVTHGIYFLTHVYRI